MPCLVLTIEDNEYPDVIADVASRGRCQSVQSTCHSTSPLSSQRGLGWMDGDTYTYLHIYIYAYLLSEMCISIPESIIYLASVSARRIMVENVSQLGFADDAGVCCSGRAPAIATMDWFQLSSRGDLGRARAGRALQTYRMALIMSVAHARLPAQPAQPAQPDMFSSFCVFIARVAVLSSAMGDRPGRSQINI